MTTRKVLSVVTISFNQRKYLRKALESVLSQMTSDVEYIVCDPGSTDGSREMLKEYASDIDQLIFEPDKGPADGLNKGFDRASGCFGYFINSDDFLMPGAIKQLLDLWQGNSHADVLLCGAWMVDWAGRPLRELRPVPVNLAKLLTGRASIVQQGFSFRLKNFRDAGGFNASNRTCWDYELLCAMLSGGAASEVKRERIGAFRIHSDSLTGGSGGDALRCRYHEDLDRIYTRYAGQRPKFAAPVRIQLARLLSRVHHPFGTVSAFFDAVEPLRVAGRYNEDCQSGG